jgi:hypothetical protein
LGALILSCVILFPAMGEAQDNIESLKKELHEMQKKMQMMMQRIEQLESEKTTDAAAVREAKQDSKAPSPTQSNPSGSGGLAAALPTRQLSGAVGAVSRAFNPAISINGLFLGGYSSSVDTTNALTGLNFENGFNLQEAEFRFVSDVDPYFRADMTLAIDREGDIELEEGFVTSNQLPGEVMPRGASLKAGKFYTEFGKHNLLHTHRFPFIDRPLVSEAAFGDEGLNEPGIGGNYLLPTPWFSEITFQGLQGDNPNLFRLSSGEKAQGAYLGHLKSFFDLSDETSLEFGQSYVGGRNTGSGYSQAAGVDLTLKWRPLDRALDRALIWQNEYIFFSVDEDGKNVQNNGGLYSSLQYRLSRRWWLQGRYDLLGVPNTKDGLKNRWTILAALVPSEFSALRLQYSRTAQERGRDINEVYVQLNFTMGSHPAHEY